MVRLSIRMTDDSRLTPNEAAQLAADLGDGVVHGYQHDKVRYIQEECGFFLEDEGTTNLFIAMYLFDEHDYSMEDVRRVYCGDDGELMAWHKDDDFN